MEDEKRSRDAIAVERPSASSHPSHASESEQAANDSHASQRELASHGKHFDSTEEIHAHLVGLRPAALCGALGRVTTREAMLALCGLPVEIADAALALLPRAEAKAVRLKMNSLGSLHLREIDRAKESVAEASIQVPPSSSPRTPLAA